jgi:carboxyl-terminal processing protease
VPHTRYGDFRPIMPTLQQRHAARIARDREFQWWAEDVAQFRKDTAEKSVSLNEANRRAERDREDAKRKQRQMERTALGLKLDPTVSSQTDDGLGIDERDVLADIEREKAYKQRPDPLLREAAAILADAVTVLESDRQLSARVLPTAQSPGHWAD